MLPGGRVPFTAHQIARPGIPGDRDRPGHLVPARGLRRYFGDGSDFGVELVYRTEEEPLGTGGDPLCRRGVDLRLRTSRCWCSTATCCQVSTYRHLVAGTDDRRGRDVVPDPRGGSTGVRSGAHRRRGPGASSVRSRPPFRRSSPIRSMQGVTSSAVTSSTDPGRAGGQCRTRHLPRAAGHRDTDDRGRGRRLLARPRDSLVVRARIGRPGAGPGGQQRRAGTDRGTTGTRRRTRGRRRDCHRRLGGGGLLWSMPGRWSRGRS